MEPGVYLVGAGPGDPDLLTVKARRLVENADVLVYDHLVNPEIVALAGPDCERVFAGKPCGRPALTQAQIEALLIERGRGPAVVVRLKGGDPCIFGRGGEEAVALAAAGIRFEIVPGITAAIGAAAYAGIPLTHRDHNSAVVFLTGHEDPAKPGGSVDWEAYARVPATLCIYMGLRHLGAITARLQRGGLSGDTPAALIESGTTSDQRVLRAALADLAARAEAESFASPALAIVGPVAAYADSLAWFAPALARQS